MSYHLLFKSPKKFKDFHEVESLYFMCMDARFLAHSAAFKKFLHRRNFDRQILAGGILGFFAKEYGLKSPKDFLLFSLDFAVKFHKIKEVILVEHDDCGAYKSALANKFKKDRQKVTPEEIKAEQEKNLKRTKKLISKLYPKLKVLMARCCLENKQIKFYKYD